MAENKTQQPTAQPPASGTAIQKVAAATALASFEPDSLDQAITLCERLAKSGLLPPSLVGKPTDVLVLTLTGRDLGLTFMQSLQSIQIIEGRPNLSTKLKVALVRRHPCCEYFRLIESTEKIAVWATKRHGNEPTMEKFTWDDAVRAGLVHKTKTGAPGMYEKWPKQMLRSRAASQLCDREYQDVLLNLGDDIEFTAPAASREDIDAEFQRVDPMPQARGQVAKPAAAVPAKAQPVAKGEPCRKCSTPTDQRDEEGKPWCSGCQEKAAIMAKEHAIEDAEFSPVEPEPEPEPPATEAGPTPTQVVLAKIAAAQSDAELDALRKDIESFPESEREQFRTPYKERKVALREAAKK